MSRGFVTGLGVLLLLGACATTEKQAAAPTGMRPLSEVAPSLGLTVKPTGFAEDRLLVDRKGRSFYLMAGKRYYRFMGDRRQLPGAGEVRIAGDDLLLPSELVASMRRDLDRAPVTKAPAPRVTPRVTKRPRPKPPRDRNALRLKGLKVVIDAGHGGKDPGAFHGGVREKSVVLPVARKVIAKLRALGVEAIPTRAGDTYPSLDARAALANRRQADLFISIHANSASRRSAVGVEAFFRADGARGRRSRQLAVAVVDGVVARTRAKNRRARADPRGLRVLRKTRMPAVLLEVGFLTNAAERRRLVDARYQERIAQGIVDGIRSYVSRTRAGLSPTVASRVAGDAVRRIDDLARDAGSR